MVQAGRGDRGGAGQGDDTKAGQQALGVYTPGYFQCLHTWGNLSLQQEGRPAPLLSMVQNWNSGIRLSDSPYAASNPTAAGEPGYRGWFFARQSQVTPDVRPLARLCWNYDRATGKARPHDAVTNAALEKVAWELRKTARVELGCAWQEGASMVHYIPGILPGGRSFSFAVPGRGVLSMGAPPATCDEQ